MIPSKPLTPYWREMHPPPPPPPSSLPAPPLAEMAPAPASVPAVSHTLPPEPPPLPWATPAPPLAEMRPLTSSAPVTFMRMRSEEHTSELQSLRHLVCRLLLEKK